MRYIRTMKAYIPILLFFSILCFACNDSKKGSKSTDTEKESNEDSYENAPELLATIPINYEDTQRFEDILITVKSVEDSRCPKGANCPWPGAAMVFLRLEKGGQSRDVTICDWDARQHIPDCDNLMEVYGYVFKVHHVLPFPTAEQTPPLDSYVVTLQIGK